MLLERLKPPARRPWGYGVLPEITPSPEYSEAAVKRETYSLEELMRWFDRTVNRLESLNVEAAGVADEPLEPLVAEYEALRDTRRRLDENLSYHRYWQQAVIDYPAFFAARNRILERVRKWRTLEAAEGDCDQCRRLRQDIGRAVAPFHPTPGLRVSVAPGGTRVLRVSISTDIESDDFLDVFAAAVAEAFEHSEAALRRRFRIQLEFTRIPVERLYPANPPHHGEHIDTRQHLGRFPKDALVLTTGAKSTHARTGRYVQLGPHPSTRRTLAHEFGHLLGFDDGYLRACEGDPNDPYGVMLIEWRGRPDAHGLRRKRVGPIRQTLTNEAEVAPPTSCDASRPGAHLRSLARCQ
jgi:hypothetical protein